METVTDFISLGSKIIADSDCSREIKRYLLLGERSYYKTRIILKSRDIVLLTKIHLVKAMVFLVIMYGCEIWTIKKAEHWRIDAFALWCWRRLLRVPWFARRSNQSILKESTLIFFGRTDAEDEAPILWPLDMKSWLIGNTLILEKIESRRRRGWQRMRWLESIANLVDMNLNKLQEIVKDRGSWCAAVHGVAESWLSDQTTPPPKPICQIVIETFERAK